MSDIRFVQESYYNNKIPGFQVIKEEVNKETITLLTALLSSKSFQDTISEARETYKFLPLKVGEFIDSKTIKEFKEGILKDEYDTVIGLLNEFDLWDFLREHVFLLLVFNMFPELDLDIFPDIFYIENNADAQEFSEMSEEEQFRITGLFFTHQFSKNELINWINDNWKHIEKMNRDYLPKSPIIRDKLKNVMLIDEIYELYKAGNTPAQISIILCDRYPNHKYVSDYAWINNKIRIYRKRIKKYSKRFKTLPI